MTRYFFDIRDNDGTATDEVGIGVREVGLCPSGGRDFRCSGGSDAWHRVEPPAHTSSTAPRLTRTIASGQSASAAGRTVPGASVSVRRSNAGTARQSVAGSPNAGKTSRANVMISPISPSSIRSTSSASARYVSSPGASR